MVPRARDLGRARTDGTGAWKLGDGQRARTLAPDGKSVVFMKDGADLPSGDGDTCPSRRPTKNEQPFIKEWGRKHQPHAGRPTERSIAVRERARDNHAPHRRVRRAFGEKVYYVGPERGPWTGRSDVVAGRQRQTRVRSAPLGTPVWTTGAARRRQHRQSGRARPGQGVPGGRCGWGARRARRRLVEASRVRVATASIRARHSRAAYNISLMVGDIGRPVPTGLLEPATPATSSGTIRPKRTGPFPNIRGDRVGGGRHVIFPSRKPEEWIRWVFGRRSMAGTSTPIELTPRNGAPWKALVCRATAHDAVLRDERRRHRPTPYRGVWPSEWAGQPPTQILDGATRSRCIRRHCHPGKQGRGALRVWCHTANADLRRHFLADAPSAAGTRSTQTLPKPLSKDFPVAAQSRADGSRAQGGRTGPSRFHTQLVLAQDLQGLAERRPAIIFVHGGPISPKCTRGTTT